MTSYRKGYFDKETLTMKFGGALSKPERRFVAQAIKAPTYNFVIRERSDEGGGWYGDYEYVNRVNNYTYIIVKDNEIIGWISDPYAKDIHTDLHPIHEIKRKEILDFVKSLQITLHEKLA